MFLKNNLSKNHTKTKKQQKFSEFEKTSHHRANKMAKAYPKTPDITAIAPLPTMNFFSDRSVSEAMAALCAMTERPDQPTMAYVMPTPAADGIALARTHPLAISKRPPTRGATSFGSAIPKR